MLTPTFRRLQRGEEITGQPVEYLGDTGPTMCGSEQLTIHAGHPGRVDVDWAAPYGFHVVVAWYGLEDSDESSEMAGYGCDANGVFQGLGWLDLATYEARTSRLDQGLPPLAEDQIGR